MRVQSCRESTTMGRMLSLLKVAGGDFIGSLSQKSARFKQAWEEMQRTIEDTARHGGESSAEHTAAVLAALDKIWARDLPKAKAETGRLLAALHDVGKPSTRTVDEGGKVRFLGHAKKGVEMAREILQEAGAEQAEFIQDLIRMHMDLFPAFDDPKVIDAMAKKDALWKIEGAYAMIDYLAAMTRADLEAINSPQAQQLESLLATLRQKRAEVEAERKAKREKAEQMARMTPEEFVRSFKGPPRALPGALKGKYPQLTPEQTQGLLAGKTS